MDIPITIFALSLGSCFGLSIFGFIREQQVPATLAFAGMFMLFLVAITDNIIMSQLQNISITTQKSTVKNTIALGVITNSTTTSNSTENNNFTPEKFAFTYYIKVFFGLISVIMMLIGGIMTLRED